jgi:hypothetical protein
VECEEGARCVIADARTATRAAPGGRLHALLKPKWNSQRTSHLEQLETKARHGKFRSNETATRPHPRRARLARGIRRQRSATCDHNVTTSLGGATGRDGRTAEQPAGRPRTVRELGSLYDVCNVYNVYNVYMMYNVYNVPDGAQSDRSRARQSATGGAIHTHATAMDARRRASGRFRSTLPTGAPKSGRSVGAGRAVVFGSGEGEGTEVYLNDDSADQ